jgi:hypothetical protein
LATPADNEFFVCLGIVSMLALYIVTRASSFCLIFDLVLFGCYTGWLSNIFIEFCIFSLVVQLLLNVVKVFVWTKRNYCLRVSSLTILSNLIVNHPSRWAPDERCGVSLIEDAAKHKTHTQAERGSKMNERRDPHKIVS